MVVLRSSDRWTGVDQALFDIGDLLLFLVTTMVRM